MNLELIRAPKVCECGCGAPVAKRFVHGHTRRGTGRVLYRDTITGRWYFYGRDGRKYYWYRIVMWNELGRELRSDEHIHHINGDKEDDRAENLRVVTRAEHLALHRDESADRARTNPAFLAGRDAANAARDLRVTVACACCGAEFKRQRCKVAQIKRFHFCSMRCKGVFQKGRPREEWAPR